MTNEIFKVNFAYFKGKKPTFRGWMRLRINQVWAELPTREAKTAQLARVTNLPVELITEYINGPLLPLRSEMERICAALGYTVDQVRLVIYRADDEKPMWRVLPPKRKPVSRPVLVKPQQVSVLIDPKFGKRLTNRQVDAAVEMANAERWSGLEHFFGKEDMDAELDRIEKATEQVESRKRRRTTKWVPVSIEALCEEHARCNPLRHLPPFTPANNEDSHNSNNATQTRSEGLCHVRRTIPR